MDKLPKNFDYDSIPVYYCTQCLSLRIKGVPGSKDMNFCDECNCASIGQTDIFTWEELYQQKYGYKFLNKPKYKNGREH